jgi:hypothetical protein
MGANATFKSGAHTRVSQSSEDSGSDAEVQSTPKALVCLAMLVLIQATVEKTCR